MTNEITFQEWWEEKKESSGSAATKREVYECEKGRDRAAESWNERGWKGVV